MEVLRPQLIWIDNRCYRKNPLKDSKAFNPENEDFFDSEFSSTAYNDEVCGLDVDIEETSKGFRLKMEVPSAYYKFIIGKKGETRARLQVETHTQIHIPKVGDKQEVIVIEGHDKKGIISAKTRIDVIIDSARQRQQFTHFLSIPINSDEVVMGFEDFKLKVLKIFDGDRGLDSSLFQNPKKLHLTVGTLVLLSAKEIEKASSLLHACKAELVEPILRGQRLEVQVKGLEYMNDDPGAVDVLYAKIEPGEACERLQLLADRLVDRFTSADLMQREYDRVKATYPSGTSVPKVDHNSRRGNKLRESFDASGILKKFPDFNFGSQHISSIHLSERFSTGQDEYYECVTSVPLPS
ncbi:unnamed protein product [Candidula unifasciata]|uniref:K Homology domain-containing protein n=1 Tax=Candidula unifasciata TaxID=100452 RepID=A0A8S4A3Z5_9EUPU|nr:unnamed protein product [Candidula unifasciata]